MQLTPMAPKCGVEITGVSLAHCSDAEMGKIKQAIYDHGVAVFREQELSPEQHIAFARRWGGIDINNYFPLEDEYPEIAIVRKKADQVTNIGGAWHTDHSYDQIPAMGSILVARVLPPSRYRASRVVEELGTLLHDPSYRAAAARVAETVRTEGGVGAACDAIEARFALR